MTTGTDLNQLGAGFTDPAEVLSRTPTAADPYPFISFAEFFAGIGLVRAALEPLRFEPKWANDIEEMKYAQYKANHGPDGFVVGDIRKVRGQQLPSGLELATSSFPCIDLSLAGNRQGLSGKHSGMFWEFSRVIAELGDANRPRAILIENVSGFASSHGGKDLQEALCELTRLGYSCDLFTIDAKHFVPQSRPRMFIVGIFGDLPTDCYRGTPDISVIRPQWIRDSYLKNSSLRLHYRMLPELPDGPTDLSSVLESVANDDPRWWSGGRHAAFINSLSQIQASRLFLLKDQQEIAWRTAYRRTRNGKAVWEIRRDGIAGCLRTTGGGSSKQALVAAGQGQVRVRWMTAREYARLMGARDYVLGGGTATQAQFGFGDAVVVDVVRWIGEHYLVPVLRPETP